jgi:glycosyltransferase involved in cell wall biosynthesis
MSQISVILITKNSVATIERALDSIVRQSLKPAEVIVVVSPSTTDGTLEILKTRNEVVILNQLGEGIGDARNYGISKAKGKWIAFLDADDEWLPNSLELQLKSLEIDHSAMVAMGLLVKIEEGSMKNNSLEAMTAVTPGGCLFRAEVFSLVGNFDTKVQVVADHKWFMVARLNNIKFAMHQEIILRKYIHGQNMSIIRRQLYRAELMELIRTERP